ncbi:MAG: hypothetical protein IZT58_16730 [Actinobacteria bacterium]|nr:hypothetical protein [Actinomycetota bacterium]
MTTDAPFHNAGYLGGPFPHPRHSAAALVAGDIVVIGLKALGAGFELDALAAAAGGSVIPTESSSGDIEEAILDTLKDDQIPVEVSMTSSCEWPISTTFVFMRFACLVRLPTNP